MYIFVDVIHYVSILVNDIDIGVDIMWPDENWVTTEAAHSVQLS